MILRAMDFSTRLEKLKRAVQETDRQIESLGRRRTELHQAIKTLQSTVVRRVLALTDSLDIAADSSGADDNGRTPAPAKSPWPGIRNAIRAYASQHPGRITSPKARAFAAETYAGMPSEIGTNNFSDELRRMTRKTKELEVRDRGSGTRPTVYRARRRRADSEKAGSNSAHEAAR